MVSVSSYTLTYSVNKSLVKTVKGILFGYVKVLKKNKGRI